MADFSYVHQIKDIAANQYSVTDYRLYAGNNDASTYKNILLTAPAEGQEPNLLVRGDVYVNNIAEGSAHALLWKVSASENVSNGVIIAQHLSDGAVVTSKIANGAVTASKIYDQAVVASKIAASAVTLDKLSANAYVVEQNNVSAAFDNAYSILLSPSTANSVGGVSKTSAVTYNPNQSLLNASSVRIIASSVETGSIFSNGDINISGSNISFSASDTITIPGYVTDADLSEALSTVTNVIANPVDPALAGDLTTLQVGSDIYTIPQGGGGGGGTDDYNDLINKPTINGVRVSGVLTTTSFITAGSGIIISGSVISATAPTYTGTRGITVSGTSIGHTSTYTQAATMAVYPIKVDQYGHVMSVGASVAIPSAVSENYVFAGPLSSDPYDSSPRFRKLEAEDLPLEIKTSTISPVDSSSSLSIFSDGAGNPSPITVGSRDQISGEETSLIFDQGHISYYSYDGSQSSTYTAKFTDTLNTAGATSTASKIYLIGATAISANPQTYASSVVYERGGELHANAFEVAETRTRLVDGRLLLTNEDYIACNGHDMEIVAGEQTHLNISAEQNVVITPGSDYDVQISASYIVINGIRLYISTTEPSGVIPSNSIGIGW